MKLTRDEHRALAFLAGLLCLSAAVRFLALPDPVDVPGGGFDLNAHIEEVEAAVAEAEARKTPLEPGEKIDPNTASAAELDRLPRVGPSLAARIVAHREAEGRFRTLADLDRVSGIGPRTLEMLEPHVTLRAPPLGTAGVRGSGGAQNSTRSAWSRGKGSDGAGSDGVGSGRVRASGAPQRVDLNRGSASELEALSGIGPVLAARIVAYRDSAGPFSAVEELTAVTGIGPATLERLRERIMVR